MSLYLTYRPNTFKDIRGNKNIVDALGTMIKTPEKMPRVFMFHGESGCGKTTFGRALANELGIKGLDYREINSDDDRGIEAMRDIIHKSQFPAMESPYRMLLLDEAHNLPKLSQDSILKLLEDTPKHLFIVLCTTEPQKLGKAVHTRCQVFQVEPLSELEMKKLLKKIVLDEKMELPANLYDSIISTSEGHPRTALQLLETVLNSTPENRESAVKQFKMVENGAIDLCRLLFGKGSWKQITTCLDGLKQQDAEGIRRVVMGYAQSILLKSDNEKAAAILESFIEPNFTNGFPQLVLACYTAFKS